MWSRVRIAVPPTSSDVGVCYKTSDSIKDGTCNFLKKDNVYFLFLQEVFQHRYPRLRIQAINVERRDFVGV